MQKLLHSIFTFRKKSDAIKDVAASFADNEIAPHVLHFDETQEFPHEIFNKLGELGFLGILVPHEYGGSGLGYQEYSVIVEEIARVCPAMALGVCRSQWIVYKSHTEICN